MSLLCCILYCLFYLKQVVASCYTNKLTIKRIKMKLSEKIKVTAHKLNFMMRSHNRSGLSGLPETSELFGVFFISVVSLRFSPKLLQMFRRMLQRCFGDGETSPDLHLHGGEYIITEFSFLVELFL